MATQVLIWEHDLRKLLNLGDSKIVEISKINEDIFKFEVSGPVYRDGKSDGNDG